MHPTRLSLRKVFVVVATLALAFATTVIGSTVAAANGVNHDDPPPAADPNCSNSPGTSGTCSSPQPPSNADQNNTGANDTSNSNQYKSTRNGAPSDNGSNNGPQTGQPCAGCVGRADNKNPQGQAPNGGDPNNGYECDGNNGIGQTNPAHTSCTASGEQGTTGSTDTGGKTNDNSSSHNSSSNGSNTGTNTGANSNANANGTTNSSANGSSGGVGPSTVNAAPPAEVLGESQNAAATPVAAPVTGETSAAAPAEVLGETITRGPEAAAGALAATGSNPIGLTLVALFLLGAGAAVLGLRHRQA